MANSLNPPSLLATAMQFLQTGKLPEAETLYRQILQQSPNHPEAWHFLGVIAAQVGRHELAIEYLTKSIVLQPRNATFHNVLGNVWQEVGRFAEAIACYQTAVQLEPAGLNAALAYNNLGICVSVQESKAQLCPQTQESKAQLWTPGSGTAEFYFHQALQHHPNYAEAYHNLGIVLRKQEKLEEAIASFQKALQLQPHYLDAWTNLGAVYVQQERLEEALSCYQQILQINPSHAEAFLNMGVVFYQQENWEEALRCYQQALQLQPDYAEAFYHVGIILGLQEKLEEAIASFQKTLQLRPDYLNAYFNLGELYARQHKWKESLVCYQTAVQIKPDHAEAWYCLGIWFSYQDQIHEAITCYQKAITIQPNHTEAHFALSVSLLMTGHVTAIAWREYLHRPPRHRESARLLVVPQEKVVPLPSTLRGQRFFLAGEQGLGDELFFLRFAPLLKQRGASWISYLSGKKLESILKRVPWLDQVTSECSETLTENIHQQWQIGDLPYLLGVEGVDQLPPPFFLSVLPQRWLAMRKRLEVLGPAPYLGVTWWAGTRPAEAKQRRQAAYSYKNIPLTELSAILRPLNATVLVLQRHLAPEEMETLTRLLGRPVYDFSSLNDDLEDMLALLSLLDEYVGVSNTNMHLMAGLGKTARVLVSHPPQWHWMLEGEESPWFKGFRVYRQQVNQDWGPALRRLGEELMEKLSQESKA